MTNYTEPNGEVICTSIRDGYPPYNAFDGDSSTFYASASKTASDVAIGYKFTHPICIRKIYYYTKSVDYFTKASLQGSNDGSSWENIQTFTLDNDCYVDITNNKHFVYYRIIGITQTSEHGTDIHTLQFYGRYQQ